MEASASKVIKYEVKIENADSVDSFSLNCEEEIKDQDESIDQDNAEYEDDIEDQDDVGGTVDHKIKKEVNDEDRQGASYDDYGEEPTPDPPCDTIEYLEIEYLEEEDPVKKAPGKRKWPKRKRNTDSMYKMSTTEDLEKSPVKKKWPKRSRKPDTMYKMYTAEDMKKSMQAVNSNKMSRSEAAAFYNIPLRTLSNKLRMETEKEAKTEPISEAEDPDSQLKKQRHDDHQKFIDEIKTILTYTNSTPYKSKGGRYYCTYCPTSEVFYDEPDELRAHVRTIHASERLDFVEIFMRPMFLNEILKLDIVDLQCVVCNSPIENWNNLFKHLQEEHQVTLNDAYNKVVPFKLTQKLNCALCDKSYLNFNVLDAHMNSHYTNYICGDCGDTYLTETRLKRHEETHKIGLFPCPYCEKQYSVQKYRAKHISRVHNHGESFKCPYCPEKSISDFARHQHQLLAHPDKTKTFSCELCGKTFDWRPYFLKHMRLKHGKAERKHVCKLCDKRFSMRHELKNHEEWHKGTRNVCMICGKKFSSAQYLKKHYSVHVEDREADTIIILEN